MIVRRVLLGGWITASAAVLAIVVVRLWDIDDQLTEHERIIGRIEACMPSTTVVQP